MRRYISYSILFFILSFNCSYGQNLEKIIEGSIEKKRKIFYDNKVKKVLNTKYIYKFGEIDPASKLDWGYDIVDSNGNITKGYFINHVNSKVDYTFQHDVYNNLIYSKYIIDNKVQVSKYKYDENNKVTELLEYDVKGNLEEKINVFYNDNMITCVSNRPDRDYSTKDIYYFDNLGQIIKEETYIRDNLISEHTRIFTQDSKFRQYFIRGFENEKYVLFLELYMDDSFNEIKSIAYDNEVLKYSYQYIYNERSLLIEEISFDKLNEPIEIIKYSYEFYD